MSVGVLVGGTGVFVGVGVSVGVLVGGTGVFVGVGVSVGVLVGGTGVFVGVSVGVNVGVGVSVGVLVGGTGVFVGVGVSVGVSVGGTGVVVAVAVGAAAGFTETPAIAHCVEAGTPLQDMFSGDETKGCALAAPKTKVVPTFVLLKIVVRLAGVWSVPAVTVPEAVLAPMTATTVSPVPLATVTEGCPMVVDPVAVATTPSGVVWSTPVYETAPATAVPDCESVTVIVPPPVSGAASVQISVRTFEALLTAPASVNACATPEFQDTELTVVGVPPESSSATETSSTRSAPAAPIVCDQPYVVAEVVQLVGAQDETLSCAMAA